MAKVSSEKFSSLAARILNFPSNCHEKKFEKENQPTLTHNRPHEWFAKVVGDGCHWPWSKGRTRF